MPDESLNLPDPAADTATTIGSIVDTVLDLDAFLSGDVRRARKSVRLCTKPWLEADLDELEGELRTLTDARGEPLDAAEDEALASGRTARVVAEEYRAVQKEYAAAMRRIDVEAMPEPEWRAWYKANQKDLDGDDTPTKVYDELISLCTISPKMPLEKLGAFRERAGHAQVDQIALAAWEVNTKSGVNVPKSLLSSHVLKQQRPARS